MNDICPRTALRTQNRQAAVHENIVGLRRGDRSRQDRR